MRAHLCAGLAILCATCTTADKSRSGPYGLAATPPMGWRSWNSLGPRVTQAKMELAFAKLAEKRSGGVSLADLGYSTAGLDDAWQACGTGVDGSFHSASGRPLVNTTTFPDMGAMVATAHRLGLAAGFYINNCICAENMWRGNTSFEDVVFRGTVDQIVAWGFDGVKIDSCSEFANMTKWAELFSAAGRPMVLENCHNSDAQDPCPEAMACPGTAACPYNLWRTSGDIHKSWASIYNNLQTMLPWTSADPPLSRPGRWAYPDMLEVGQLATFEEDRAHFGAWCITSSPLTLGYDVTDDIITTRIWPIVANTKAIGVNQAWAGSPGRLVHSIPADANASTLRRRCGEGVAWACCDNAGNPSPPLCGTQVWAKPLNKTTGAVAVFLLNNQDTDLPNRSISVDLGWFGVTGPAKVLSVWDSAAIHGPVSSSFNTDPFGGHDSRFYIVTPTTTPNVSPRPDIRTDSEAPTCEDRCFVGAAGASQPGLGHCCVGLNSSGNTPSCAMGCLFGRNTPTLEACRGTCIVARTAAQQGHCDFAAPETGNATIHMCASCVSGAPGDCRARFGPTVNRTSTCTVQSYEAWAPVRGCVLGDCFEGCLFHHGCPALDVLG